MIFFERVKIFVYIHIVFDNKLSFPLEFHAHGGNIKVSPKTIFTYFIKTLTKWFTQTTYQNNIVIKEFVGVKIIHNFATFEFSTP